VVIGIAKYQHPDVPDVEFAVNDAVAIKRMLVETLGYREDRVLLRTNEDASVGRLKSLMRQELPARVIAGKSDVFVYYSGHGAPNADTREASLIPWDYDPRYALTSDSAYPLKEFYSDLGKLKSRSVTVTLDACFSGRSESGMVLKDVSPPYIEVPLPELPTGLVVTATGPREVATWDREHRHGLLTYYLLRALRGEAADEKGRVTAAQLERYLKEKVPQAARELRQRNQTPQVTAQEPGRLLAQLPISALKTGEAQVIAQFGSLQITIDVGGELLIDGVPQGVIPAGQAFVQKQIAAGPHTLEIKKERYKPIQEQVMVLPDQPLRKTYQLAAILPEKAQIEVAYGLIQVTADAGGTLYIDAEKAAELSPFARYTTGRIKAGPHQVRVEKAGYQAAEQQVLVLPNQTATAELKLTPIPSVPTPSREEPAVQPTLGHEAVSYIVTRLVDRSSLGLSRSRALNALASDAAGNLYVADADKHLVLKVTPARQISVVAGTGDPGFNGDERPATSAQLSRPQGLALDSAGNLYIADHGNDRVRKVTPGGVIVTVTQLSYPAGVALDGGGNLYILGTGSRREDRLRKVSPAGTVSSVAGVPQGLFGHIVADTAGNLYLTGAARENRNRVFRMSANGAWGVVAGTDERGGFDGDGQPATSAQLNSPTSVAVDAVGNLYIADRGNNRIRKVTPDGLISTIAGTGERGKIVDGDPATWSPLDDPCSLALDNAGNLYVMPGSLGRFNDPGGIVKLVPRQKPAPAIPVHPAKPPTAKRSIPQPAPAIPVRPAKPPAAKRSIPRWGRGCWKAPMRPACFTNCGRPA
jgi:sugar lactone lactonase YvrE